jgi:hypothetical protein
MLVEPLKTGIGFVVGTYFCPPICLEGDRSDERRLLAEASLAASSVL